MLIDPSDCRQHALELRADGANRHHPKRKKNMV
jgi:hypothetical protein